MGLLSAVQCCRVGVSKLPKGRKGVVLPITGYAQLTGYSCGFVAALTVCKFFKPEVTKSKVWELLPELHKGKLDDRNVDCDALMRALKACRIKVFSDYDLCFSRMQSHLEKGRLLIVSSGYDQDTHEAGSHWSVVYGAARNPTEVFVSNWEPGLLSMLNLKKQRISWEDFYKDWSPRRQALVAYSR